MYPFSQEQPILFAQLRRIHLDADDSAVLANFEVVVEVDLDADSDPGAEIPAKMLAEMLLQAFHLVSTSVFEFDVPQ